MAIVGLTGLAPKARRIGKLFKGAPKETKKRANGGEYQVFGKELDHWRFESDSPILKRAFEEAFKTDAGKPRHIPVFLPFPQADANFTAWKEAYVAGGIEHRCDGKTCVLWYDAISNEYRTDPKPCPTLDMTPEDAKYKGCKQVGRLEVIVPALNELGVVTVETHSKHDILFFDQHLPFYEGLQADGLRRIPFILSRVQREIATLRDGKRVHVKKWLIELHVDRDWSVKFLSAQRQQALAAVETAEPLLLTAAEDEDDSLDDGHADVEKAIFELWLASGKSATDFVKYRQEKIALLTLEQKQAKLAELQKAVLDKQGKAKAASASSAPSEMAIIDAEVEEVM